MLIIIFQIDALFALLDYADWRYVQVVAGEDAYGASMHASLMDKLEESEDICAVNTVVCIQAWIQKCMNCGCQLLNLYPVF